MNLTKKVLVFALMLTTVLWSFGGLTVKAAGNYGAGSLLALSGAKDAAVYYIGSDGKKYVFPDAKTYYTWYANFDDVVRVSVAELDMYEDGGAVTYRAGTKLITHENTAKIYAVEPGGVIRWIPTAEVASNLYGANWASMVMDVIPGYFSSSYTSGADLGSSYPVGTLLQVGEDLYYVSDTDEVRPFANADAFEANNFVYSNVRTVANVSGYGMGESITGEEIALSGFMPAEGGGSNVTGGNLTVSLASDTPASNVVVTGAARVGFTKVKLMTGDKGVTVDQMVVQRGGLAQDGAFASVDILDASTMLPFDQNSKTFNSLHQATFNKDLVLAANTTKNIYLAGNMLSGTYDDNGSTRLALFPYAGETPALGLASVTLLGGGSVSGSLPVFGNYHTVNASITIGSATVSRGSYTNATSSSIEVGKQDYTFFSFQVNAGSVEDVIFDQVSVYQEGTAVLGDDVQNFELFKDGTKVANGTADGKYVSFSGINTTIPKGQTYQYQVKADVEGGSGRTIDLGIYRATDLLVKGVTYGYNITPTYSGTGSSSNTPVLSDNEFTISNGTLTVERGSLVGAENVSIGNDQTLGSFKFTVKGEQIDVTALTLTIVFSTTTVTNSSTAVTNVRLVNSSGAVVAGPTDLAANTVTVPFTDTFTLPVGETELKVVANLGTSNNWATDDTIYARLNTVASAITATGVTTGNSITASPAAAVNTNTQTIKGAYLSVTRNTLPADGTVIAGAQDVLLGSWSLDATNSGEDIRITSLAFAASSSDATNLTVYKGVYGSGGVALSPINDAPTAADGATSTFAFDDPIVITKGSSVTVQLIGDINSGATTNNSAQFGLTDSATSNNASVVAYGVSTGIRAYTALTSDDGATLTYSGAGVVTVSTHNNPTNAIVRAGATGVTMGNVKLDAQYEDLDLDQLVVFVDDGGITGAAAGEYRDITMVYIYDGSTLLASNAIPSTGKYTFNFANGTLTVPKDGSKTLTLKADFGSINQNVDNSPATPAADVKIGFGGEDGFKFTGNASNQTATETYNGSTSSSMVLHKSVPTVTYSQSGNTLGAATTLTNGALDVFAFKVTADSAGGEVLLYRSTFDITTGGGVTDVTACYLKDENGNTVGASANPSFTSGVASVSYVFNNPNVTTALETKEALQIAAGASKTYKLNCTIAGAASGNNLKVALVGDLASSTPDASHGTPAAAGKNIADAWGAYDRGSFVWSDNYKNLTLGTGGTNATNWGQWYNGYLVAGLGTEATGSAYTISW